MAINRIARYHLFPYIFVEVTVSSNSSSNSFFNFFPIVDDLQKYIFKFKKKLRYIHSIF